MTELSIRDCTCFDGTTKIAAGPLRDVILIAKRAIEANAAGPVLIYDDVTGDVIDVDIRGTEEEVVRRLHHPATTAPAGPAEARARSVPAALARQAAPVPSSRTGRTGGGRRGRPKLGVVGREVTLLPRHWDWLGSQPGGASVTLRKLVEQAVRASSDTDKARRARDAAYGFMSAMAGDMPGFEEASRALFAGDAATFRKQIADWPRDVHSHVTKLAFPKGDAD